MTYLHKHDRVSLGSPCLTPSYPYRFGLRGEVDFDFEVDVEKEKGSTRVCEDEFGDADDGNEI